MRILHTADWHIGQFKSPEKNGVNLRYEDTIKCLTELVKVAEVSKPDYVLVSGDVFNTGRLWSDRCCEDVVTASRFIAELAMLVSHVVVLRGTPNHDGRGQFDVLNSMFNTYENVHIVMEPKVLSFDDVDIVAIPGFERGFFRAKFPGLSKEEENEVFTQELSNIVAGLKAQCSPFKKSILMSHYTVPGCNTESGQVMMLTHFEPIIPQEALLAANYDLVAMGHIHRPQQIANQNWFYSGAINALNFNDEGQERGFWLHDLNLNGWEHRFVKTSIREFHTITLSEMEVESIIDGDLELVANNLWRGHIDRKIVRVRYSCTADQQKAFNKAVLEKTLLADGAFMVWEILPDQIDGTCNKKELAKTTDPELNLIKFLEEQQVENIQELVDKARTIIAEAQASMPTAANTGFFEPVSIEVKNYRNYEAEHFDFSDITFCTINGQNGAGKSSLFMDAIVDCLYEEPREGEKTGWIRNGEKARSGSIMFTFKLGRKTYRVTRTRARSGKGTLNLAELVDGNWADCSKERYADTQAEILSILGMDSMTFKSCALIMQDQYGLFLQARPEERVEILSTLLGLSVYSKMERLAGELGKVYGAKNREAKQAVDLHNATLLSLGKPEDDLEKARWSLALSEQEKAALEDKSQSILSRMDSAIMAVNARTDLELQIQNCKTKCDNLKNLIATQNSVATQAMELINKADVIKNKARECEEIKTQKLRIFEAIQRCKAKRSEAASVQEDVTALRGYLRQYELSLGEKQKLLAAEMDDSRDADIEKRYYELSELTKRKEELEMLRDITLAKKAELDASEAELKMFSIRFENEVKNKEATLHSLAERISLLERSGCSNADNATCRFLADAQQAKELYPEVQKELEEMKQKADTTREQLTAEVAKKTNEIQQTGFSAEELQLIVRRINELKTARTDYEHMCLRKNRVDGLKVIISDIQGNITLQTRRLQELVTRLENLLEDSGDYEDLLIEDSEIDEKLSQYEHWTTLERQLPVALERYATALDRRKEAEGQIQEEENRLLELERKLADSPVSSPAVVEQLRTELSIVRHNIAEKNSEIATANMLIGSLGEKAQQKEDLRQKIDALQEQQVMCAKETAAYDRLKAAFGQSGIPHQIIRSIIPQLMATANSILGQMTGGKLGVEFRLDKLQKNGKEKVTLDIYIEEYGKNTLNYLSKSGGEKVKSALSVILSLAELKTTSAGIQLGMLFIDEPPFLDGDGIQAYCDALETIQNRYPNMKIMAITHDPTMKARFPQSIDVVKTENGSKLV